MTKVKIVFFASILLINFSFSQEQKKEEQLEEVIITSSRIDLPFSENSRTISVITTEDIKLSAATNVSDLLQQVAGVDLRRRGTNGMQADLYIRGGSFDQTLLLIDGIKVEDAQTGHHTMNMALPLDVIKHIEIIKGPAARVFGQNAFTGAINIVTKSSAKKINSVGYQLGSYGQQNVSGTIGKDFKNSTVIAHASINSSDGYRYNTDFQNQNYFLKGTINRTKTPVNILGYFTERKFGANGFYATPSATDQYEETQSSLVGLSTVVETTNLVLKPRMYWKRNQDMYIFIRNNPSIYRNLHQTNKIGAEISASYQSNIGITGFGVDVAKVYLSSNNLGQRDRETITMFLEHRFKFLDDKFDVTPGLGANYFSDFDFHLFPGIDLGYEINDNLKIYGNIGYTYRIPTYTDLYYSDRTTIGDENLEPEEAISEEIGLKYQANNFNVNFAFFNRDSSNLIDYVKDNEDDRWQATNIRDLNTLGFEIDANYGFKVLDFNQKINFGYTFLEDEVKELDVNFSRYSINSLKHHFTTSLQSQFLNNLSQSIVFKYAERTSGDSYTVIDASIRLNLEEFEVSAIANNIFNTEYTETNLVPMPKGNMLFGLKYKF